MTRSFYDIRRLARCFSDIYALADGCYATSVSSMIKYHHIFVLQTSFSSRRARKWREKRDPSSPSAARPEPRRTSPRFIRPTRPRPLRHLVPQRRGRHAPHRGYSRRGRQLTFRGLIPRGHRHAARSSARAAAANLPVIPRAHPPPLASPPTPRPPTAAA